MSIEVARCVFWTAGHYIDIVRVENSVSNRLIQAIGFYNGRYEGTGQPKERGLYVADISVISENNRPVVRFENVVRLGDEKGEDCE